MFNKGTALLYLYQYILVDFLHKAYSKVDFGHAKFGQHFLGQSLLLSTTILNDEDNESVICKIFSFMDGANISPSNTTLSEMKQRKGQSMYIYAVLQN